jgi:hypothetical protein
MKIPDNLKERQINLNQIICPDRKSEQAALYFNAPISADGGFRAGIISN